jgi:hypothetical protein
MIGERTEALLRAAGAGRQAGDAALAGHAAE